MILEQKEILIKVKKLVKLEQRTTAEILKALCLVEKDKLYLDLGYNSLFKYLCEELGHSEGEATRRINACRMLKEFPQIISKVSEGKLNLTNLSRAAQIFKQSNLNSKQKLETLTKIESKSTRVAEQILFSLTDIKIEVTERQRRVSKEQISISLVFSDEEMKQIEKLKGRLNRAKNLTTNELIMNLVSKELQKTETPSSNSNTKPCISTASSKITNAHRAFVSTKTTAVVRSSKTTRLAKGALAAQVLKRAQYKCEERACDQTRFLQIHHLKPYSKGGLTEISNLEVLCHAHHAKLTL